MALEIRLKKGGETVVKTCPFIPARKYLEYLELEESIDNESTKPSEVLDKRIAFIVSLFDDLTVDDLYDGLSTKELPIVVQEVTMAILGGGDDDDPKDK
ncbi:phage tail assembly chaperone G [Pseudolactococcus reticulitermitis]|uniref:Phage protein n=1 Tax=Pseudolactococcus reticulitermitis TaxID=2025039 RepID=A0A224XCB4_9LACT|nr:hypothetical protein [Lactococcus reticulitermitis]GAX47315.1 hypothetical protein RsY01_914 [Lactococcus reticulitermitis]